MISRENIHDLVSIFYRPTFKTFYVNSLDGVNMKKPYGVFVSLGMTTSLETLNNIKDIISDSKDYNAVLAEISSRRVGNQFIYFCHAGLIEFAAPIMANGQMVIKTGDLEAEKSRFRFI